MDDLEEQRKRYEHRGEFEHELLNRRVTWLLSSQTILFAAYGLSLADSADGEASELFREFIPQLGLFVCAAIWLGIVAAFLAKVRSWLDFRSSDTTFRDEQLGVRTWITVLGYVPDCSLPLIFMWAWSKL